MRNATMVALFGALILLVLHIGGCSPLNTASTVATGIARVGADMRAARDAIDAARPSVGPVPAAHLAEADSALADGETQLVGAARADALRQQQLDKLAADDAAVRGTIGYRLETFIVRSFWVLLGATVVVWVGSIALYVVFGGATGWVGVVARELHAILPLMAPANWIASLVAHPPAAVPVVATPRTA